MPALTAELDAIAERTGFSGVIRVDRDGSIELARAYGDADRAHRIPNTVETRFGVASGAKSITALTILSLVEEGLLDLTARVRPVLGADLPLIGDDVTVEQLLSHRSGIGDYLDEDGDVGFDDYLMPVPVHELATTEQYVPVLEGHEPKFSPGERFSYCNSGFVVLALVAERVTGEQFADLVHNRVCRPAGLGKTSFLRSDELPGDAAVGYLHVEGEWRSNVLHLPVRGSGDGGIYTTAGDISALWQAMFAGAIVSAESVAEIVRPRSEVPSSSMRYGLGFWLHGSKGSVVLEGADAGVSFRSTHDPRANVTATVISNTSDGAWPLARHLRDHVFSDGAP